jgi:hypothetical protein
VRVLWPLLSTEAVRGGVKRVEERGREDGEKVMVHNPLPPYLHRIIVGDIKLD